MSSDFNSGESISLGALVVRKRAWRARARLLGMALLLITVISSFDFLWPLFLPADYSNPVVAKFVSSDLFHQQTDRFFDLLRVYNKRKKDDKVERPGDFYAGDNSSFALLMRLHYRLIPSPQNEEGGNDASPQYRYQPEISLGIYWPQFAPFVAIIVCEILLVAFIFRKEGRFETESDEKILSGYFSAVENFLQVSGNERSEPYVSATRIDELKALPNARLDTSKLVRLVEELNAVHAAECHMATGMLIRAITDHVPPVFGVANFAEVANNYSGGKSFKGSMSHLQSLLRNIADAFLHTQMRKSEALPTWSQVDFRSELDVLLGEVIRILRTPT